MYGLQLKKNGKGKLGNEIRKKEANKADSKMNQDEPISTKMNQIISMFVVSVKIRSRISSTGVRTWAMLDNFSFKFRKEKLA